MSPQQPPQRDTDQAGGNQKQGSGQLSFPDMDPYISGELPSVSTPLEKSLLRTFLADVSVLLSLQ